MKTIVIAGRTVTPIEDKDGVCGIDPNDGGVLCVFAIKNNSNCTRSVDERYATCIPAHAFYVTEDMLPDVVAARLNF